MGPIFINPQPITKKEIQGHNPQIHCIYTGKKRTNPKYKPISEKKGGSALGTIFEKVHSTTSTSKPCSRWLGKVGMPTGRLKNDPATVKTRTEKEINLDTIREKLGYDLYQELGRDIFKVPKTRLSLQPMMDSFNIDHQLALTWIQSGITQSLRIMSRYIDGYYDFKEAKALDNGVAISFINYLKIHHRPPLFIVTPNENKVPLKGIMGLLAVGRTLADTDIIGGSGGNAGFTWVHDSAGKIIGAQVVKIDPGECFKFALEKPDENERIYPSANWVLNTKELQIGGQTLLDLKDLQIAQNNNTITIHWNALTTEQKDEFLSALFNCSRYLSADTILEYLFYRDGKFNRNPKEQIPLEIAKQLQVEMMQWLTDQLKIYKKELLDFQKRYTEETLRVHYIDRYGELPLPTSHETFPIRELFTQLVLIEHSQQKSQKTDEKIEIPSRNPDLPERDSLMETYDCLKKDKQNIVLEELFSSKGLSIRKVLLLGRAGIGKSTLCQKIAHDWASGLLWKGQYKAIYWLRLRECNAAIQPGGFLADEKNLENWLSKAISNLVLNQEFLSKSLKEYIHSHKQEILIMLDGCDEASPELIRVINLLLADPTLTILLTSRPGIMEALYSRIDRLIENNGFSDEQLAGYANRFFQRKEQNHIPANKQADFFVALKSNPHFYSIAHIPLQLQMLCARWEQGVEQFPSTLTELYGEMTHLFFCWHYQKKGKDLQEKDMILECLGKLALGGLDNGKQIIPESDLKPFEKQKSLLLASGLLKELPGTIREYEFLHLTFQEYLAAWSISQSSEKQQRRFVLKNRYRPQFQLTMSFLAGMNYLKTKKENLEPIKNFFELLHSSGADMVGISQMELVIRCLNECPEVSLHQWLHETYKLKEVLIFLAHLIPKERYHNEEKLTWLKQLFQRYPVGVQEIWRELCEELETHKSPLLVIQVLHQIGKNAPAQYIDRFATALIKFLNPGIFSSRIKNDDEEKRYIENYPTEMIIRTLGELGKVSSGKLYSSILKALIQSLKTWDPSNMVALSPFFLFFPIGPLSREAADAIGKMAKQATEEQILTITKVLLKKLDDRHSSICSSVARALSKVSKKLPPQQLSPIVTALLKIFKEYHEYLARNDFDSNVIVSILNQSRDLNENTTTSVLNSVTFALRQIIKRMTESQISEIITVSLESLQTLPNYPRYSRPFWRYVLPDVAKVASEQQISTIIEALLKMLKKPDLSSEYLIDVLKDVIEVAPTPAFQIPLILETLLRIKNSNSLIEDSGSLLKMIIPQAFGNLARVADEQQNSTIVKALFELLENSESSFGGQYVAEAFCKLAKSGSEHLNVIFESLLKLLKNKNFYDHGSAFRAIGKLVTMASESQTSIIISTLLEELKNWPEWTFYIGGGGNLYSSLIPILGELANKISVDQVPNIIETLLEMIKQPKLNDHREIAETLNKLAILLPEKQIYSLVKSLLKILKNCPIENSQVKSLAIGLDQMWEITPSEKIPDVIMTLKQIMDNNDLHKAIRRISLKKLYKLFGPSNWKEVVPVFVLEAIRRKSPLYIQGIEKKLHLCTIENNQVINQVITIEQLEFLKTWIDTEVPLHIYPWSKTKIPLNLYTSNYLSD